MQFALFIATPPEPSSSMQNWNEFLLKVKSISREIDRGLALREHGVFLVPMPSGERLLAALFQIAAGLHIESRTRFFESQNDDLSQRSNDFQDRPIEQRAIELRMDALAAVYGKTHNRDVLAELQSLAVRLSGLMTYNA